MQNLNNFTGGLNTFISPNLISINEARVCKNINTLTGNLQPLKEDLLFSTDAEWVGKPEFFFFEGDWVKSTAGSSFVTYNNILYYTDGIGAIKFTDNGTDILELGITAPTTKPSITPTTPGETDDTYSRQYCYTYVYSTYGHESAPSPYSDITEGINPTTIGVVASTDINVDTINVYRIGDDLSSFTLVGTYPNTTGNITDIKSDLDIAENEILSTIGTIKPPSGLNYLTTYNNTLFASTGSKLYFSEYAVPNSWSELQTIELADEIIGIGATQNGLLLFNRNRTYILQGTDSSNFSLRLLNGSQGCIDHSTIQYLNNTLIWVSLDGICSSIGAGVTILTEMKLGRLSLNTYNSVVYDNQYFLFHSTGTYIVDYKTGGMVVTELDEIYKGGHYSYFDDTLYLQLASNDSIVKYTKGANNRSMTYKTGWLVDVGLSILKTYKKIYIYSLGALTVTVYVDGDKAIDALELEDGLNEFSISNDSTTGYYMELEVTGTGTLYSVNIATVEERETYNG